MKTEKEILFNYKDIGGNILTRKGVRIEDQIFELLNTYYGISRKEFNPKEIKIVASKQNQESRQKKLMSLNPHLFATVKGFKFYEHPIRGDESPLMMMKPDGELIEFSDWFEVPTPYELED